MDTRDPLEKAVDRAATARRVRNAETTILELHTEMERLQAVAVAARKMPRWTPKGGAASTMHTHQIMAADTWALDKALSALDAETNVSSETK